MANGPTMIRSFAPVAGSVKGPDTLAWKGDPPLAREIYDRVSVLEGSWSDSHEQQLTAPVRYIPTNAICESLSTPLPADDEILNMTDNDRRALFGDFMYGKVASLFPRVAGYLIELVLASAPRVLCSFLRSEQLMWQEIDRCVDDLQRRVQEASVSDAPRLRASAVAFVPASERKLVKDDRDGLRLGHSSGRSLDDTGPPDAVAGRSNGWPRSTAGEAAQRNPKQDHGWPQGVGSFHWFGPQDQV